jgi:O-antigen ligase
VAGLFTLLALLLWIKKLPYFLGARAWMIIMAFVIGFGIITPIYSGSNLAAFTSILGRNETITGRTEIWKGLLNYVEERPILGLGFGSFWTTSTIEEFEVSESHNGYLEVQLELGIVGLALITIFLLSCTRMAHQKLSSDYYWGSLWISFLLMFLLHNISEATINSLARPPTAIILFLAVSSKRLTLPRTKT